jgi:CHAT domain-containing protein
VASGDELLGLQRALIAAGARTVVCTLWEATDLPAVMLMDRFYRGLRSGQTPAIALRDAQVALRTMTAREVLATLARWRAEGAGSDPSLWEAPVVAPELLDVPVYADPFHWAPFLLIGRPW